MKSGSTAFLKGVILLIGLAVLLYFVVFFPIAIRVENEEYRIHFIVMYLSMIPFYFGLYQCMRLLHLIDKNMGFSELSVKALKFIKYCAIVFGGLYALVMPYVYYRGDVDDAPGPIALGFLVIFASIVVATFAAVLQKLVQNGVDLKYENELTV